jgi:hypothetical protein
MAQSIFIPAVLLVVLLVVLLSPRSGSHQPSERVPDPPIRGEEPPTPLPTDQRAHLAWLADNNPNPQVRSRAIALLRIDDRRRGRERGYRRREV